MLHEPRPRTSSLSRCIEGCSRVARGGWRRCSELGNGVIDVSGARKLGGWNRARARNDERRSNEDDRHCRYHSKQEARRAPATDHMAPATDHTAPVNNVSEKLHMSYQPSPTGLLQGAWSLHLTLLHQRRRFRGLGPTLAHRGVLGVTDGVTRVRKIGGKNPGEPRESLGIETLEPPIRCHRTRARVDRKAFALPRRATMSGAPMDIDASAAGATSSSPAPVASGSDGKLKVRGRTTVRP